MAKQLSFFFCLYRMRRHSAGPIEAAKWAFELCHRNRQTNKRRARLDRREEVERAARQRL
ncbi:hypothetical protein ACFIQG_20190 [Comamonas odontotermitis]|uniref:hypothetical protein n=1 Tax=Comamonas odontotermitis TaxID=379895 RepID=UPI003673306A